MGAGECRPRAERVGAFRPREERKAVPADGFEQDMLDRGLVGVRVGPTGELDRAEAAAL